MLLIVSFFVRHNLTKAALVDLLQILNLIFDSKVLPESHYKFTKYCHNLLQYSKFFYCSKCKLFMGKVKTEELSIVCKNCSSEDKKYFIANSIAQQLKTIISKNFNAILEYKEELQDKFIGDITQGLMIKELKKYLTNFFTISFNTDGIATFKSNIKKSLWPIIITINELPPKIRYLKKNMIVAGLWLDNEQPSMDIFMNPFCDELKLLYTEGILLGKHTFKIICTAGCVDSCARCKLLNFKQFNGKFGCSYCLHPGELVKVRGTKQIRYTSDINGCLRNSTDTLKQMKEANTLNKTVFGVKGISVLISIPKFNLSFGLPVDIMHGVFLGVAKTMAEMWFDSKNHKKPFYIGKKIRTIDKLLLDIHPFSEISRYPRHISQRHQWKANEWVNFII